jgi:hypothetical protein
VEYSYVMSHNMRVMHWGIALRTVDDLRYKTLETKWTIGSNTCAFILGSEYSKI